MSDQQEAAAKWGMFENYKKLVARQATLQSQLHDWGQSMASLADSLHRQDSDMLRVMQGNIDHLPTKESIRAALSEMETLAQDIHRVKHQLKQAGMDNI